MSMRMTQDKRPGTYCTPPEQIRKSLIKQQNSTSLETSAVLGIYMSIQFHKSACSWLSFLDAGTLVLKVVIMITLECFFPAKYLPIVDPVSPRALAVPLHFLQRHFS